MSLTRPQSPNTSSLGLNGNEIPSDHESVELFLVNSNHRTGTILTKSLFSIATLTKADFLSRSKENKEAIFFIDLAEDEELLPLIEGYSPLVNLVAMVAKGDTNTIVKAMRAGAIDFIYVNEFTSRYIRKLIKTMSHSRYSRSSDSDSCLELMREQNKLLVNFAKQSVTTDKPLELTLADLAQLTSQTIHVARSSVWMFSEDRSEIVCTYLFEHGSATPCESLLLKAADYPSYFEELENERVIAARNAFSHQATRDFTAYLIDNRITSLLDVPIRSKGEVVGIICNEQIGPRRNWSLEDQVFVASVADYATLAIESSERGRVEQALESNEAWLHTVVSNAPLILFGADKDGILTLAEGRGLSSLALSAETMVGRTIADVFSETPAIIQHAAEALTGKELTKEIYYRGRAYQVNYTPLYNTKGEVEGVIGYALEITESKKTRDALERQRQFFRQVIDINPNLIFAKDRDGCFTLANKAIASLYGTSCEDILGKSDADFNENLKEVDHFREDDRLVIDKKQTLYIPEEVATDASGKQRWLQTTKCPVVGPDGETQYVLGVATDITDRKRVEQALRKNENILRKQFEFEKLISTVSTRFINLPPELSDLGIRQALEDVAKFAKVDRCCIFDQNPHERTLNARYEWCQAEIPRRIDEMQGLSRDRFPWFSKHFFSLEPIVISSVDDLPPEANAEKEFISASGAQSLLCIPLISANYPIGFLALSGIKTRSEWTQDIISLLKPISEIFVSALERKRVADNLASTIARNEQLRFVAEKLNFAESFSEVYMTALQALRQTLKADRASLLLYDDEQSLRFSSSYGLSEEYTSKARDYSPWRLADLDAQPISIKNVSDSTLADDIRTSLEHEGISAVALFPLIGEDQLLGRLMVYFDAPHVFDSDEMNFGRMLSVSISATIRRLYSQQALKENEALYRTFFEEDLTGDFIVDIDGKLLACNHAFAQIFGFSSTAEALKCNLNDLYPDTATRIEFLEAVRTHRSLEHYELELRRQDGRPVHIIENVRGIFDEQGNLKSLRGYIFDITERKIAEQKLREHAALLDNTQDAIVVVDLSNSMVFWNTGCEKLYGWKTVEALGKGFFELLSTGDEKESYENALRVIADTGKWRGELTHRTKFGKLITVESRWTLIRDHRKRPKSILLVNTDITEKKKWEAEMLKASKLESLGVLAGGIAHDFNNILTAIVGNLSLAQMSAEESDPVNKRLARAQKATKRAKDLTQQLLTFAKGGSPIKKTASISELIKETIAFAVRGAKSKVDFSIPKDIWPVEIDEGQISQVIHNLVLNALQAMPDGGVIKVRCSNMVNEAGSGRYNPALATGRFVRIEIIDQGVGIPETHLTKIFDPYFSTKDSGSGLGLATTYSIVKKHQGHISVDSVKMKGTTFTIHLPAATGDVDVSIEESESIQLGEGRVLIMDDDENVREIVGNMLQHLGYEPEFAEDGEDAISKYIEAHKAEEPFKAVIMDLTIPGGIGGKEAIRRLRKIHSDVTAIVSSGYSNDPIMANYQDYGFQGVVAKPYELRELSRILGEIIT